MASVLKVDTLTGVTTAGSISVTGEGNSTTTNLQQGLAKVWANWNGTGTVAIRDSFNTASITDNGTGDYTTNVSNAMANANYCFTALGGDTSGSLSVRIENASNRTTTTIDLISYNTSNAALDIQDVNSLFHGDLA
tara:strand:+ start:707 stop:1114 length:408 start_codon:yes stop_codon:yes gene_type:complete